MACAAQDDARHHVTAHLGWRTLGRPAGGHDCPVGGPSDGEVGSCSSSLPLPTLSPRHATRQFLRSTPWFCVSQYVLCTFWKSPRDCALDGTDSTQRNYTVDDSCKMCHAALDAV